MTAPDPNAATESAKALAELNQWLSGRDAEQRLAWALAHLPGTHVLSSSFGAQAAVSLHMATRLRSDIPVVVIDTGYLFPETYRFADELQERLKLNLQVFRPLVSRAWMEARHGRLWENGLVGIEQYNGLRKVEPMKRALKELGISTWFTGLRRSQASSRTQTPILQQRDGRLKVNPIADWTDRDIWVYLKKHDLPYHPLWNEGYVSIGDFHTTSRWEPGMSAEDTRYFGIKRECGIHLEV